MSIIETIRKDRNTKNLNVLKSGVNCSDIIYDIGDSGFVIRECVKDNGSKQSMLYSNIYMPNLDVGKVVKVEKQLDDCISMKEDRLKDTIIKSICFSKPDEIKDKITVINKLLS